MHDRNGKPLAIGDEVVLRGKITSLSPDMPDAVEKNRYCNVGFVADVNMGLDGPGNYTYNLSLNAGQVEKVD